MGFLAGWGSRSLAIPCSCILACVGIPLALFVPLGWRPLWWRVPPVSWFRGGGRPSYHRFIPLGIPSYHSCSVPRCWRLLVLRVFFGGVHIFSGVLRLPSALMASGERADGGFHGICSVGVVYFVLVVRLWSFYPRGDCCGGRGLVLLCHTLFVFACARGHTTLALCVPSGLRFVCLVAVVCSPAACGSLPLVSRGLPSYHHFSLRGLPTRCALIPSLFRTAVLVVSCSSCVLLRCPHFLQRWWPIGCECSGKEKGWRFHWLLGALALHVSPSSVALVVYIHTFCCLRRHI